MNADVIATGAERVFVRGRGWNVIGRTAASDCTAVRLREIGSEREQTLLIPFDRLRPLDSRRRPRLVRPRRWLHELDRERLRLHPFGGLRAAASAPVRLLPYQLEPAIAMLRDGTARLLIADKVGLGKTIQAGLILLELSRLHEQCRALVIVPAGLREQWIDELWRRLGLTATLADSAWIRTARSERPVHVNPWSLPGIYVSSHDLVKRPEVLRPLEDVTWDIVVVDEAHVATSRSDRRAAVHAIAARSRRVVLLSATPNSGDRLEFEALCDIGSLPSDRSPVVLFERSRAAVGEHRSRRTRILSVACTDGERRMHEMLQRYCSRIWREANLRGDERARLVAIVLRKRALSSAASLAASVERRLTLLSGAQIDAPRQLALPLSLGPDEDALEDDEPVAGLAAPGLADADSERRSLSNLAAAAHNAARDESKTRFLLRLLARLGRRGVGSALIFTEYRDTLARLVERLTIAGHGVAHAPRRADGIRAQLGSTPVQRSRRHPAGHRRRRRRTQSPSLLPPRHSLRAAVEPDAARAAVRTESIASARPLESTSWHLSPTTLPNGSSSLHYWRACGAPARGKRPCLTPSRNRVSPPRS